MFVLTGDTPVRISQNELPLELTTNELVNLLLFKGSFDTLSKVKYEGPLRSWVQQREVFGPSLIYNLRFLNRRSTIDFENYTVYSLFKHLAIIKDINVTNIQDIHQIFDENPLLSLEMLIRTQKLELSEIVDIVSLEKVKEILCRENIRTVQVLLSNVKVISLELLWKLMKGIDLRKFSSIIRSVELLGKLTLMCKILKISRSWRIL